MTTNLGKHCKAENFQVKSLVVSKNATLPRMSDFVHGGVGHDHTISTNGSVVYFKYAFVLEVEKFISTNGSTKVMVEFKKPHHFDGTQTGVKVLFSGGNITGNLRGLVPDEFVAAKHTFDAWDSITMSPNQLTFDVTTAATSTGDVSVSPGMVGTMLIYKYLDLAGPSVTWEVQYDQAPAAKHNT